MHALALKEPMTASALTFRCNFCQDRHRYFSVGLKKQVPCPKCTRRPRHDTAGMRALIQNEADRRQIQQARELTAALRLAESASSRVLRLDPVRAPVDRIMQRWAAGEGDGLRYTSDELDERAKKAAEQPDAFTVEPARSPPLDDETQIIVDHIVIRTPRQPWDMRHLVREWYRWGKPARVIADECDIHRSHIYRRWHDSLDYLRGRFEHAAHPPLIRLMLSPV